MKQDQAGAPWWKHGYVWLVISGPAAVVVASMATLWLATSSPEIVLTGDPQRRGEPVRQGAADPALLPAIQGRNHAAAPPPAR